MKTTTLFIVLFLFTNLCFAQDVYKYGYQKPFLGMKGKVKTLTDEILEIELGNDTTIQKSRETVVFEFSKNGKLKSKSTSYEDYKNTIIYSQYENGRAMRFDREIITPEYTDKDSSRLFVIDNRNERLITWKNYNQNYAQTDTTLIYRTGDEIDITPLGHIRDLKITEVHDIRGNLIRETRSIRGSRAFEWDYIYDKNDLLVSEDGTKIGASYIGQYNFLYEYEDFDKQGNWRKKIVKGKEKENGYSFNSEKTIERITLRQITYY